MAGFQFAEVTRTLYDAVWTEYCDWGLELAKTRLGDASLPAEAREATWWTLVEALDTYLRLLHPVMPFLTEALWASFPHAPEDPDLLIVAAWPTPGALDPFADMAVASLIELVHGTRNARAEAGLDAAAWLPMDVAGPAPLIAAFEDLRAALERLGRARPLRLHGSRDALVATGGPGSLTVIARDVEARITAPARAARVPPSQGHRPGSSAGRGSGPGRLGQLRHARRGRGPRTPAAPELCGQVERGRPDQGRGRRACGATHHARRHRQGRGRGH